MNLFKKLLTGIGIFTLLLGVVPVVSAVTVQGFGGGTGFASTTSGNVGNCLQVSSSSPFLLWTIATCGGGSGSVSTSSPISINNFPFWKTTGGALSGTSTLTLQGSGVNVSGTVFSNGTALGFGTVATSGALTAGQWLIVGAYNQIYSTSSQPGITYFASGTNITVSGVSATGSVIIGFSVNPTFTNVSSTNLTASGYIQGTGKVSANNFDSTGSTAPNNGFTQSAANVLSFYTASTIGFHIGSDQSINIDSNILKDSNGNKYVTSTTAGTGTLATTTPWAANALVYTGAANSNLLKSTSSITVLTDGTVSSTAMRVASGTFGSLFDFQGNKYSTSTSGGSPGSPTGGVQYNESGVFTASSSFTFSTSTNQLKLGNTSSSLIIGDKFSDTTLLGATGGTVTYAGGKEIHTFNTSGTFQVINSAVTSVQYLIVGGGGSGGSNTGTTANGGGGGGGGVTSSTATSTQLNVAYTVTVGSGAKTNQQGGTGTNGATSSFNGITASGGGGGAADGGAGANGATGGGGSNGAGGTGTANQGFAGGTGTSAGSEGAGGGGGEGFVGVNGSAGAGGDGGGGATSTISGVSVVYGGGGGGAHYGSPAGAGGAGGGGAGGLGGASPTAGTAGTNNLGGGGGGGGRSNSGGGANGGAGGDGIVIISFTQLSISSDYASSTFALAVDGHILSGGATSSVSSCGSGPSIVGNDTAGSVAVGSGVITSCTITFSQVYISAPICVANDNTSVLAVRPVPSTTGLVLSSLSTFAGDTLSWICFGL